MMERELDHVPEQLPGTLWASKVGDLHVVIALLPPGAVFGSVGCCRALTTRSLIVDEGAWRVRFEGETLMDGAQACNPAI